MTEVISEENILTPDQNDDNPCKLSGFTEATIISKLI